MNNWPSDPTIVSAFRIVMIATIIPAGFLMLHAAYRYIEWQPLRIIYLSSGLAYLAAGTIAAFAWATHEPHATAILSRLSNLVWTVVGVNVAALWLIRRGMSGGR